MSTDTTTTTSEPEQAEPEVRREASVMELATVIAGSRDFPDCRTPEKAAVRILAGREMGVGPIASVIGIRVQNGRVSMDAALLAGVIKRSGTCDYKILAHDNDACVIEFFENGAAAGQSTFTMTDAKTAGLANKDTWKGYPRNMLFARALANGARWYCAGLFGGSVYTHEELGYAVDEEGRAIEAEAGAGSELCTRDQRQEIARLVEAAGDSMPGFLAKTGIKLLDELSEWEAAKEIKKLQKRLTKSAGTGADSRKPAEPSPADPSVATPTPAQDSMAAAMSESCKPATKNQCEAILGLAQMLLPDEDECMAMLQGSLAKRNVQRLSQLSHLQAAAMIEALQTRLAEKQAAEKDTPPFDPTPQAGT